MSHFMNNVSRGGQGVSGNGNQPSQPSGEFNLEASVPSERTTQAVDIPLFPSLHTQGINEYSAPSSLAEYYLAHVTNNLKFASVPVFHRKGCFECHYCGLNWYGRNHKPLNRTFGLLSDHHTSHNPTLRELAYLYSEFFKAVSNKGLENWLDKVHHFNVAIFHAPILDPFLTTRLASSLRSHIAYVNDRIPTRYFTGGILGGAKKNGKNGKRQKGKPGLPPTSETAAVWNPPPQPEPDREIKDEEPEPDLVAGGAPVTYAAAVQKNTSNVAAKDPKDEGKNKPKQQQNSKGGRANFRNDQVGQAVAELGAQNAGGRDARREIEEERRKAEHDERKREEEEKEAVKRHKQALATGVFNQGPRASKFSARPAANVSCYIKRKNLTTKLYILCRLWNGRIPRFVITAFTVWLLSKVNNAEFKILFGIPFTYIIWKWAHYLIWLYLWSKIFSNPRRLLTKIFHTAEIHEGTVDVSQRDIEGGLADTRPSEIKIGNVEMSQLEQRATIVMPVSASLEEPQHAVDAHATARVYEDPEFVAALLAGVTPQESGVEKRLDLLSRSPYLSPRTQSWLRWGKTKLTNARAKVTKWVRDALVSEGSTIVSLDLDPQNVRSFTVLKPDGKVDASSVLELSGAVALLNGPRPYNGTVSGVLGSYTPAQVAEPNFDLAETEVNFVAYKTERLDVPFCAHSYNNACSYGSLSSQVSAESNYAMLYRKLSRYTAIAQDRFGNKELVTNAEILCRLRYWAVREKPLARAAASNF